MWKAKDFEIRLDSSGVTLLRGGEILATAAWNKVTKVVAYQTDEFTVDTRWLRFEAPDGVLTVNEDIPGYGALEACLGGYLAIEPRWQESVARTAFDRNETVVFQSVVDVDPANE